MSKCCSSRWQGWAGSDPDNVNDAAIISRRPNIFAIGHLDLNRLDVPSEM